jgi:Protein of unknown function (DUF402)
MRFVPGSLILHRNTRRDRIGWVRPARVVSHDERGLLLWVAPGSRIAEEVDQDGLTMRHMPFVDWIRQRHQVVEHDWRGPGILKLLPPGAAHSVWWFRDEDGRFAGWYVNLEEPAVAWQDRTLAGVDIVDQDLDIWVPPSRYWQWKDEGEFAERLGFPDHYWVHDAAAVRAEGERVIKQIEAGRFPFDGTWCDFKPDPGWSTPTRLPPGWDRPPAPRGNLAE